MNIALSRVDLLQQLQKQLNSFFLINEKEIEILETNLDQVLERCEYCFSRSPNKYFHNKEGETVFSPYISTQYVIFLYYYANTIFKLSKNSNELCDKLYYLNKIMNSVDIYFAVELPDFFMVEHPVGSVMGRAQYSNGFQFFQNCTVGGVILKDGILAYPKIGENVMMFAASSIIGNCLIGDNVSLGAGALIKNQNIPSDVIVFGSSPSLIIKEKKSKR